MSEHDQPDSTNPSEIEALISRLKQSNLSESDSLLAERLFRLLLTLIHLVERKNTSISRLKRLQSGKNTRLLTHAPQTSIFQIESYDIGTLDVTITCSAPSLHSARNQLSVSTLIYHPCKH